MEPKNAIHYAWRPYIITIALIVAAAALRLWPLQILELRLTWLTFYPAVMIAALFGGFSAGLLGTILSCLTILCLWPVFGTRPFIRDSVDWLGMAVFFATCMMISAVTEAMRRASARAAHVKEQLEATNEELEAANEELAAANKKLEAANSELEAFSYSVSHDLRAPLRAIDGFSRILIEDHGSELPPEALRLLQVVRDGSKQMGRLIDDLLAFARLSRQPLRKQTVALAELVYRVLDDLRAEREGREVDIRVGELPTCEADPALLKQVFTNLLSNALKFTRTREQAAIEVGCQDGTEERIYFVKDNGVGFDMRYGDKLFGVFQRLHRSEEYEGTGVGLAIVQRVIHRHGGRVWAEAELDKGATFCFAIERGAEHE